ncbi:MAG: WHG domain-containing protein, partial [Clostridia bacterium]|nr:WHG domain-containing protein [Clostridia bacterium]
TQPVFSNFPSMEHLKTAVITQATRLYREFVECATGDEQYPPYKARGMAYIRFAKEESELFQLLYMSKRREGMPDDGDWDASIDVLMGYDGISPETAKQFQFEMWMFVHGIAAMIATGYMSFSEQEISRLLSDAFLGLKELHWPTAQEGTP